MCLHPRCVDPVPEQTARVARAAFPKGTTYMTMRDELGTIFEDEDFAHLFPSRGQPAMAPWRLALITIMQFAEGLSDRQAEGYGGEDGEDGEGDARQAVQHGGGCLRGSGDLLLHPV